MGFDHHRRTVTTGVDCLGPDQAVEAFADTRALLVVVLGTLLGRIFESWGGVWVLTDTQLVDVPRVTNLQELKSNIRTPDFSQLTSAAVYVGAITIAVVASLETLLNLDAVDKLDKRQRISPPNRELFAQGIGNMIAGLLGGIPVTSVIIRGSVNVNAGAQTKLSAIFHGLLLLGCVAFIPQLLQLIPLSCLAAILLLTGYKLASPALFKQMWSAGRYQFLPFMLTLVAIVLTDLLVGVSIGLVLSLLFILHSNLRRPIRRIHEKHIEGEVLHIELANQVSFLNRAALESALREAPPGSRVLLDARRTDYIAPDILSLIKEFKEQTAPVYNVQLQLVGFRDEYEFADREDSVDFSVQEAREKLTPAQVIDILKEGNKRFVEGHPLDRVLHAQSTPDGRPLKAIAAVVTGIDARIPVEMIFDLGLGDAYVLRVPGIVVGSRAVGGAEFAARISGVKLIVIMGHAESSLISLAVERFLSPEKTADLDDCAYLQELLDGIALSIDPREVQGYLSMSEEQRRSFINRLARRHILRTVSQFAAQSPVIQQLVAEGKLKWWGRCMMFNRGWSSS